MPGRPTTDELLTAEQAQRRLGVGRSLFWKLVKSHGVPQFVEPVCGHGRTRSLFRPQDVEQLRAPVRRVLRAAAEHRLGTKTHETVFGRPDPSPPPQQGTMSEESGGGRCRWPVGQDGRPCGKPAADMVKLPLHWATWSLLQAVPFCAEHLAAARGRPTASG